MSGTNIESPRLQLRWENAGEDQWICHYELVMPLEKYDIRREIYDDDGDQIGEQEELVIPVKSATLRTSSATPCLAQDGGRYFDAPYRDGAHAKWDAKILGGLPIFVIGPDGMVFAAPDNKEGITL